MYVPCIPTTCIAREPFALAGRRKSLTDEYKPALTIVVPVYNNAGSLAALQQRLESTLDSMDCVYEIIYVNDASTDESYDFLVDLCTNGEHVRVVDLEQNFGQSAAILSAFSVSNGDIIVTIDADLENHPEDIPALVAAVRDGADLVCGLRSRRQASFVTRKGPSWIANRLVGSALGIDLRDWGCGLNAVTAEITQQILAQNPLPTLPKIEAALLAKFIYQVPVAYSEREHGQSGYTVWRLCGFAVAFLRSYSITRTFRRLLGVPTATSRSSALVGDESSAHATTVRTTPTVAAVLSWAFLAGAAIVVRFGILLSGSASKAKRYQIREILE